MAEAPKTTEEAVAFADEHLDKSFERLEKAQEPVWRAYGQMMRTLVTLAAGAFVVTLSLVQLLAQQAGRCLAWKHSLPISWVLFGITIVSGTIAHSYESVARSARFRFEAKRSAMREAVRTIPIGAEDYSKRFDAVLVSLFSEAEKEPVRALRIYNVLARVCGWSFIAAMIALLSFAIRNLPF